MNKHPYAPDGPDCAHCPLPEAHSVHDVPSLPGLAPAAEMNAVGSPTGRIGTMAPETSLLAAATAPAATHREILLATLKERGQRGLTSIEAVAVLPNQANGQPQSSSRTVTRLGELWEAREATVLRTSGGGCELGRCHAHDKPKVVHTPSAPCEMHGKPVTRGGAAVWVARTPIL